MLRLLLVIPTLVMITAAIPLTVYGESRPDPTALMSAQREAMDSLAFMDGTWRGTAWTIMPSGEKAVMTQTERVGPLLDGSIKVIDGRSYGAEGRTEFNALGIISYDPVNHTYNIHSYAQGRVGDFVLTPTADGFVWEIPAGPMTIRYTAVIKDGTWREIGERILPDKDPVQFFEMNLTRLGETDWPAGGAVSPE